MAAHGISGHSWMALIDNQIHAFEVTIQGALTDYISVAADVRADDKLRAELEQKLLDTIEAMAGGTSVAVNEKVHQSQMPLERNAAEALHRAVSGLKRDVKVVFGRERLRRDAAKAGSTGSGDGSAFASHVEMRDFFLSHAGEDRQAFVSPLAEGIVRRGKSLWYSEYEITLGDSLRARIDRGLSESRFGVVVLSHAFFTKPWPQAELDALASRSMHEGRKVILPVRHQMTIDELRSRSPLLAGVLSVDSSIGVPAVVEAIIRAYEAE
jgi:hypothetical protein